MDQDRNSDTEDGFQDADWEENIKQGGAVPYLDLDNGSNGWSSPPGDSFQVRGPNYLSTRIKIPAGEFLLKPLGFDWLKSQSKINDIMKHPNNRILTSIADGCKAEGKQPPFVWAFNLQVPSKEHFSAISYFASYDEPPAGSLMERFLKGDESFRNSRLKLIANIVKGPWIVKTAVGEQAICILGKALTCKYSQDDRYIEIDCDIGSSMVANAIVHLAIGYITSITVDLAFLIEAQNDEELPEQILGAIRFADLELTSAMPLELLSDVTAGEGNGFFPARIWKSIGQFLHTGSSHDNPAPETKIQGSGSGSDSNHVSDEDYETGEEE